MAATAITSFLLFCQETLKDDSGWYEQVIMNEYDLHGEYTILVPLFRHPCQEHSQRKEML